jgi:hypothetical protein
MDGGAKGREGQYQRNDQPRLVVTQVVPADGHNTQRHDADGERFQYDQDKICPLPGQEGKRRNQPVGRRWIDRDYARGQFGESFARDSCLRDVIRIASVTPQPGKQGESLTPARWRADRPTIQIRNGRICALHHPLDCHRPFS